MYHYRLRIFPRRRWCEGDLSTRIGITLHRWSRGVLLADGSAPVLPVEGRRRARVSARRNPGAKPDSWLP